MTNPRRHQATAIPSGRVALGLLVGLLLHWTAACAPAPEPATGRPNLLLIVVDTLRWDRVGCYGADRETTPAIDRLAASGVRFERAYATAPWTMPSVASMLTGAYPSRHAATSFGLQLPPDAVTLAERLRQAGYATAGVVSHTAISDTNGFAQGYDVYLEDDAQGQDHLSTAGVTARAMGQLDRLSGGDRPFLLFVHYFDPHYNYLRHAEYGFAPGSAGRLDGSQPMRKLLRMTDAMTPDEVGFLRDLYDGEIRHTDDGIGRLLAHLDELGLRDDTWVVLTADHGEEFLERGTLGHTSSLYEELVRVPLIVRTPTGRPPGHVVEAPVSLVDLTPTLLDLLEIETDTKFFHGVSLAPWIAGEEPEGRPVFVEVDFVPARPGRRVGTVRKKALIDSGYKLIRDDPTGRLELYAVEQDPGESADLASAGPERLATLRSALERAVAVAGEGALEPRSRNLASDELRRLEALGYVDPGEAPTEDEDPAPESQP